MNKIKAIYATQISEEQDHNHIKSTFDKFRNKLDTKIKDTIVLKKKLISKQANQLTDQLNIIKEQANKCKRKIYEQQREFQQKIQNYIQYDINKWSDYQNYFKDSFTQLESSIQNHKKKNRQHLNKIGIKKVQLKQIMQEQKISHVRVSSLLKRAEQKSSNKTTKQSSVQLSYSPSSHLKRIKTQSSLPALKPSNRLGRFKTIQSESDIGQYVFNERKQKRVMTYMEPIGTLRKQQQSSFPLLIDMLKWYKEKEENNIGDNWFLKILFSKRNFNKLINFMSSNSLKRKIQKKL